MDPDLAIRDGGRTWSIRRQVGRTTTVIAGPALAAAPDGTIAVLYYDVRHGRPGDHSWSTDVYLAHSYDGSADWHETHLAEPFHLAGAPARTGEANVPYRFLGEGDFAGLAGPRDHLRRMSAPKIQRALGELDAPTACCMNHPTSTSRAMPGSGERRLGRFLARARGVPTARDWQRSVVLEARPAPRVPDLVGDGGGLPFSPLALDGPPAPMDPRDPATEALALFLGVTSTSSLDSWRLLARTDCEAVFGQGRPPELRLVATRRDGRRGRWRCASQSTGLPLRATRDGVRASSWRLDPESELHGDETILRILLTEQTHAGGRRADGRVLAPDLFEGPDELVLRMYVRPQPGFQTRTQNPETPVRVALTQPVGSRQVIDGAIFEPAGG